VNLDDETVADPAEMTDALTCESCLSVAYPDEDERGAWMHLSTAHFGVPSCSWGCGVSVIFDQLLKESRSIAEVQQYERDIRFQLATWPKQLARLFERLETRRSELLDAQDYAVGARSMRGIDFANMQPHLGDPYLVKGLAGRGTLVGILGASGAGKTFLAADLATHIAAGRPWRGRRVKGGLVVYCALEGAVSAERRFVACRERFSNCRLRMLTGGLNLRDPADVQRLVVFIQAAQAEHGQKCAAVFVDTLSRALAGGNENDSEHMGALIVGADLVKVATGATVFLVHHFGKDETRGGRGWSGLKGALDTEIEVTCEGEDGKLKVATVSKQRDLPGERSRLGFTLHAVQLGLDEDGEPVTTCLVEPTDAGTKRIGTEFKGKNQLALLPVLREWKRANPDDGAILSSIDLKAMSEAQGITGSSRRREVITKFIECKVLLPCVGGHKVQL
jgi:hypothetical protein